MNFRANSTSDGKSQQIEGTNLRYYGSSGDLFEGGGGLLTIFSSRMGAYSRGALSRGGAIRGFTVGIYV